MRLKQLILYTLIILCGVSKAQSLKKNLVSANSLLFHHTIYVYGFEQQKSELLFKCFAFDQTLHLKDSIDFKIGKHTPIDYLETSVDTIHNVINFYFQLADEKNAVTLLRLNDTLEKICSTENYDANHINSMAAFDDETSIFKNNLFVVRTNKDTAGTQFYLNAYQLTSMLKPFEYTDKWQFAFERQFIHHATVVHADSNDVMIYVNVNDGSKKGQWILRINANSGELIKGTRLGSKIDGKNYLYSNSLYDPKTKSIVVIGSIYEKEMIDFKNNNSNFINLSKRHQLFLICIDRMGEVISKTEKLIPLPLQTNNQTFTTSYHLKIREFKKTDMGYNVWTDMYEQTLPNTFVYYSSWHMAITPNELDYDITPSRFLIATKAIPSFISYTKGDTYGKFILDRISDFDAFLYKKPANPVVIKTAMDDLGNPFFVLKKVDILLGTKSYNYVFLGKKGLENKVILACAKDQKGNIYFTKELNYLSFTTNTANSEFELKLNKL
jgi:hypothetical protein